MALRWNQAVSAVADEVWPAQMEKGGAKQWPVFGIVVAQKGLVQPTLLLAAGHADFFATAPA
jgi:hypothetical protein